MQSLAFTTILIGFIVDNGIWAWFELIQIGTFITEEMIVFRFSKKMESDVQQHIDLEDY